MGDATAAEAAYLQALELEPAHPDALQLLGSLARARGEDGAAELWWRHSLQAHGGQPQVWNNLGNLLLRTGRPTPCPASCRRSRSGPTTPRPTTTWPAPGAAGGPPARRPGPLPGAAGRGRARPGGAPSGGDADAELHANFAASLLIARQGAAALAAAEAACRLAPHDQYALALPGLAWRMNGDPREAWLNDVPRFVRVCELPPPAGWADMASFNIALAAELATLHGERQPPIDQTLRHGTQTLGDTFEQGHPLVDALKARITEAVADYIAALPPDPAHPFLKRRGSGWRSADSWSSRLGRHGLHTDRVHPHGWVSSACYVQVPASCADVSRRAGWLRFGQPDFDTGLAGLVRREVVPAPGRLVLFPSMFWHGTTPLHDDAARLTIAFDVMPL